MRIKVSDGSQTHFGATAIAGKRIGVIKSGKIEPPVKFDKGRVSLRVK